MVGARIVAALALVVLSACSNGLSKEEFIEQADRLCREADEKTQGLTPPRSAEALKDFVDQAQEITSGLLRELRDLEPPEGDTDAIDDMLENIESAMELLPDIQVAAEDRDFKEIERLSAELQEQAADANEIARDYGLKDCGRADPAAVP
jgi:uncharacterized membrane protein YccC